MALTVGPEGGFTDEEIVAARTAGWRLLDLGPRILRIETAALVLAAWAALCRLGF
jgi:16S rRNA (uracil1498-N3)-methyltransferase